MVFLTTNINIYTAIKSEFNTVWYAPTTTRSCSSTVAFTAVVIIYLGIGLEKRNCLCIRYMGASTLDLISTKRSGRDDLGYQLGGKASEPSYIARYVFIHLFIIYLLGRTWNGGRLLLKSQWPRDGICRLDQGGHTS